MTVISTAPNNPLMAAGSIMVGMMVLSLIDNFIADLAKDGGVWQFLFLRGLMIFGILLVYARVSGQSLRPRRWRAVIWRSIFVTLAMMIYFSALGFLSVAQAAAGLFTSPIFVLVISALFLGVPIGIWRFLAVGAGFVGILLVLRPWEAGYSLAVVLPVFAGAFYAIGVIATRRWCAGESTLALITANFIGLTTVAAIGLALFTVLPPAEANESFIVRGWVAPTAQFWAITAMQAVGSLIGVIFLTKGYQWGDASYVTVFEYSVLVFAAGWAFVLWGTVLPLTSAVGIVAIFVAGAVIALRSRVAEDTIAA